MAEKERQPGELEDLLGDIDLLLDGEAGAEGPRLLEQVEADPEGQALYHFSRSIELALEKGLEEPEIPEGMWSRLELQLREEPPPRISLLDRVHHGLFALVQGLPRNWALSGSAFLFLITCGSLWWDGGAGFMPAPRPALPSRTAGRALDRILSDQLDREAAAALDQMLLDFTLDESLQGAPSPSVDPAERGNR